MFFLILSNIIFVSGLAVILILYKRKCKYTDQKLREYESITLRQNEKVHTLESNRRTVENQLREEELERLQLELQLKEQDLMYHSLVITNLKQANKTIEEKLSPFQFRFQKKKDQEEFKHIMAGVIRDTARDPMGDFEIMFKQMHQGFYEKLLDRCSDLTRSELQVCALLRLNLSSKDMARMTNLSISTIDITRHHIRKKFGLDQNVNLTSYLIML